MTETLLSILICTIDERKSELARIQKRIADNFDLFNDPINVIINDLPRYDMEGGITVGEKRQQLLDSANGKYIWFLDDDDDFTDEFARFVKTELRLIDSEVICGRTKAIINGKPFLIDTSIHHENEQLHDGLFVKRFPSVMNIYRRDVALRGKFPHKNNGEDFEWSQSLGLKDEFKSSEIWHIYNYDDSKTVASKA